MPRATKVDLDILMSDGSTQNVNFTIPNGEQGPAGKPSLLKGEMVFPTITPATNASSVALYHSNQEATNITVTNGSDYISPHNNEYGPVLLLKAGIYDINIWQVASINKLENTTLLNQVTFMVADMESMVSYTHLTRNINGESGLLGRNTFTDIINIKFEVPEGREAILLCIGSISQYDINTMVSVPFTQNSPVINNRISFEGFVY